MILLDTCAVLWLSGDQSRLTERAKEAIRRHAGEIFLSAVTALEIGLKVRRKKIELQLSVDDWYAEVVRQHALREIPISGPIAARATMLPEIHFDPCDRILIATAIAGKMAILTADQVIPQYPGVRVIW